MLIFLSRNNYQVYLDKIDPNTKTESPADSIYIKTERIFKWEEVLGSRYYTLRICRDESCDEIVYSKEVDNPEWILTEEMMTTLDDKRYFWTVRSEYGKWTDTQQFFIIKENALYVIIVHVITALMKAKNLSYVMEQKIILSAV